MSSFSFAQTSQMDIRNTPQFTSSVWSSPYSPIKRGEEEEGALLVACRDVLQGARHLLCPASVHPSDGKSCREAIDPEQSREQREMREEETGEKKRESEEEGVKI